MSDLDKLQRRLDAVQALMTEERQDAALQAERLADCERHTTELQAELGQARADLERARRELAGTGAELGRTRRELSAAQREIRTVRASSTFRAGLAVKRAASPALWVARRARAARSRGAAARR
jgi:chromosome segregation ATPase